MLIDGVVASSVSGLSLDTLGFGDVIITDDNCYVITQSGARISHSEINRITDRFGRDYRYFDNEDRTVFYISQSEILAHAETEGTTRIIDNTLSTNLISIKYEATNRLLYVLNRTGEIYSVDPNTSANVRMDTSGISFPTVIDMVLDKAGTKAFITSDTGNIYKVDFLTGVRSLLTTDLNGTFNDRIVKWAEERNADSALVMGFTDTVFATDNQDLGVYRLNMTSETFSLVQPVITDPQGSRYVQAPIYHTDTGVIYGTTNTTSGYASIDLNDNTYFSETAAFPLDDNISSYATSPFPGEITAYSCNSYNVLYTNYADTLQGLYRFNFTGAPVINGQLDQWGHVYDTIDDTRDVMACDVGYAQT